MRGRVARIGFHRVPSLHVGEMMQRRTFLKAAGVSVALPLLESLPAAETARPGALAPRRMVCIGNEFGMYPGAFWPKQAGADYELTDSADPNAFYVIAKGDSMVGGRIQEGDYLLISPNLAYESGDIVLARTDDGVMVKRYRQKGGGVSLEPLNPEYKPTFIENRSDLKIFKVAEIKIKL